MRWMPGINAYPIVPTKTIPLNNAYKEEKIFPPDVNPSLMIGPMPLRIIDAL